MIFPNHAPRADLAESIVHARSLRFFFFLTTVDGRNKHDFTGGFGFSNLCLVGFRPSGELRNGQTTFPAVREVIAGFATRRDVETASEPPDVPDPYPVLRVHDSGSADCSVAQPHPLSFSRVRDPGARRRLPPAPCMPRQFSRGDRAWCRHARPRDTDDRARHPRGAV